MTKPIESLSRRDAIRQAAALGLVTLLRPSDLVAQEQAASTSRVTLVLANDLDRMADQRGRGGHAKLATVVKTERARGNTLFIHAGDAISPSILSGFDKGHHIIDILNRIAPDVFTPGNHEFDFGAENFRTRMAQATFDVLAANIHEPAGGLVKHLKPSKMVEIGGIRVGILGVTTEETADLATPEPIRFRPAVKVATELAARLRADGADLVVAVTHIGFDHDFELVRSGAADVILSGHDHNLVTFWNGRVALVESASQADFVTPIDLRLTITQTDGKRRVSFVPNFRPVDTIAVTPDPEIAALIARYEGELDSELNVVVGETATALDTRSILMRSQETAFGNLVCDAMRQSVAADVCLMNGGSVRANRQYPAGTKLTRRHILEEMPFGNKTVLLEVKGVILRAALEHGLSGDGAFPQVSGITIEADMTKPVGKRLRSVHAAGAPLDDTKLYKLATNDYLARGGDGYVVLKTARTLIDALAAQYMASNVMSYIAKAGAVSPKTEGRIVLTR